MRAVIGGMTAIAVLGFAAPAVAAPANALNPQTQAQALPVKKPAASNGNCSAGALVVNALNPFSHCNVGSQIVNGAPQVAAAAASAVGNGVMDQVTSWMVDAAKTIDGFVEKVATSTTTPELSAPWYRQEFGYLAAFGAALAGLVTMIGLASAAIRGDPHALGEVLYGILRAGIVTGMVIAIVLLALTVTDGISADIMTHMPKQFFQTLSQAWGSTGWAGLGSSALAFLVALIEVFIGLVVWIELLFRNAVIYIAVLFFPVSLAVAIWPRLGETNAKLTKLLGIFIVSKPVMLLIMMTGGNLALAGVSLAGGLAPSVGTLFAGLVVLAMAMFAPWAVMSLVGVAGSAMGYANSRGSSSKSSDLGSTALGGELMMGGTAAMSGGMPMTAMAGTSGARGGGMTGGSGIQGASQNSESTGGSMDGTRRMAGPMAAAAGLLPAGMAVASTVAGAGRTLAGHAAARTHVASGHGGFAPGGGGFNLANSGGSRSALPPVPREPVAPVSDNGPAPSDSPPPVDPPAEPTGGQEQ